MSTGARRHPPLGARVWTRCYADIWCPGRVNAVSSDGGIEIINDEGAMHEVHFDDRGKEWRYEGDPHDPKLERRAVVELAALSGLRDERVRVMELVRASATGWAWTVSPDELLALIESGERAATPAPSSERAS